MSDLHTQPKVTAQPNHFTSLRGFLAALDQIACCKFCGRCGDPPGLVPGCPNDPFLGMRLVGPGDTRSGRCTYGPEDMAATISSGSFPTRGMVVAPCSVKSLAQMTTGVCDTLLTRAADVTLKERRRLVLVVRETPLTLTHLRNMAAITEAGAIIAPPVPAFYTRPSTLHDMIDQTVGRVLDLFGIDTATFPRWGQSCPVTSDIQPCAAASSA